jgi:chemotaxis protein histidine kinase CheA/ActR/RegA family two-component response regulator
MINDTELDGFASAKQELLLQVEPWLALLGAQSPSETGGDAELGAAFFGELRNATQECAQLAQKAGLRGLSNVTMLLLRGMDARKGAPLDDDDVGQLTLWLTGFQAYLEAQLPEPDCLLTDLKELSWMPRLAPAAETMLIERLSEPMAELALAASAREALLAAAKVDAEAEALASAAVSSTPEPDAGASAGDWFSDATGFSVDPSEEITFGGNDSVTLGEEETFALGEEETFALGTEDAITSGDSSASLGAWPEPVVKAQASYPMPVGFEAENASGAADLGDGVIWIAPEEFQLVTETVQSRLLPVLSDLAQESDVANLAGHYAEAQYQIELLGNAFAVLGLERSQAMCTTLGERLSEAGADAPALIAERAPALMQWIVQLVDFCARPDALDARAEVVAFVASPEWFAQLDSDAALALKDEIARIQVGMDPSLRAARKTEILLEDTYLTPADDVMPNVLQGMLMELPDNAHALSENIELFNRSGDPEAIDNARRVAHTLKGDANTVGIKGIANLTHSLEDIFIELAKDPQIPGRGFADLMTQASDCVSAMADHVLGRGAAPHDSLAIMQQILNFANSLAEGTPLGELEAELGDAGAGRRAPRADALDSNAAEASLAERLAEVAAALPGAAPGPSAPAADVPMLQVPADVLDRLLDFSSEALVLLRQIETQINSVDEGQAEIERQRQDGAALLVELDKAVNLRGIALQSSRNMGESIDPLELDQYNELYTVTRRLMEVSADEQTSRNVIERAARRLIDLAAEQEKVQLELQDQIMRTRQVSVKEFVGRFQRAVRQTSKMLDKDVDFVVSGQDTMIDRVQMENLIDPLMHALRNSVDHGVENQSMRMTRGKPLAGQVKLSFERDGRQVSVKLTDDGAGLNYERIRAKAIQRGFMSETDQVSNDDLAQVILLPGFSTKEEVTQVSGRGIGLDVVYQRIQDLRGSLAIRSKQGNGTTMDISLPASMTSLYCALAPMGTTWAAIASDSVESFQLIEPEACEVEGAQVYVTIDNERMPLLDLEAMIGGVRSRIQVPKQPGVGVLVRGVGGEPQLGFLPEIKEMRTIIVKDFGPYLRAFPGVRGGTILGDGSVAPVIDARELMRNTAYQPWSARDESYREALAKTVKPKALIADDSLSVRRALEQLLRDAGFDVMSARDGLEALALINQSKPDIMLLDLEMPRMNGLEVSSFVRKESALRDVPIIMITSRTSEKHVQMAKEAGVNEILSKPYSDDTLLEMIQGYLGLAKKDAA